MWIPYYGGGNVAFEGGYYGEGASPVEPYAFWSCCYPANNFALDVRAKNLNYDLLRDLFAKRDRVMKYYYGDFYPLTVHSQERAVWMAWQFDQPEVGEGLVQAFRRSQSNILGYQYKLKALDEDAEYEITDLTRDEVYRVAGKELMDKGLKVIIDDQPGVAVMIYKRIE